MTARIAASISIVTMLIVGEFAGANGTTRQRGWLHGLIVQESRLACYEGNDNLEMAIKIEEGAPVTLYVWIKNVSGEVRLPTRVTLPSLPRAVKVSHIRLRPSPSGF